jgi:hypothetical protein
MIWPAYIFSASFLSDVIINPISGGVIFGKLYGEEKKLHASSKVIGKC